MNQTGTLAPAQRQALDRLLEAAETCPAVTLRTEAGMGRTTILRQAHAASGGAFLNLRGYFEELGERHPHGMEEAFLKYVETAMERHRRVAIDDLHCVEAVCDRYHYPRHRLFHAVLTAVVDAANANGGTLIFGAGFEDLPGPLWRRGRVVKLGAYGPADYEHLCRAHLEPHQAGRLDYEEIHRYAPRLSAWLLEHACRALRAAAGLDTARFLDYLASLGIQSNVALEEVRKVTWSDLKGMDDVIEALEAKIALPLENHQLAAELGLKPRRGVLLAGPPGTGKTTIGRALAHRLKGKFFLIDGTVISGSGDFYEQVDRIFASAVANAPSVVFIDDTDVIFENKDDTGFYRYLLTKLDGLESASVERVCVMMTAMEVSSLPPALVRSGRIELWLTTRLPDRAARVSILTACLAALPPELAPSDLDLLAAASHGLTGADLRSAAEDGKLLLAGDRARGRALRPAEDYFLEAIATVRANRRNYARRKPSGVVEELRIGFPAGADFA